jgi:hypothetical protein
MAPVSQAALGDVPLRDWRQASAAAQVALQAE